MEIEPNWRAVPHLKENCHSNPTKYYQISHILKNEKIKIFMLRVLDFECCHIIKNYYNTIYSKKPADGPDVDCQSLVYTLCFGNSFYPKISSLELRLGHHG